MSFKTLDLSQDVASVVSAVNEVVSISSSIYANNLNVKRFRNIASSSVDLGGYWQTIYDASPTSSLSTPLFDLTYGYTTGSSYNVAATVTSSQTEKVKVYREFAGLLLGDQNSAFTINNSAQTECFFIMMKRGLQKDEVKKGATSIVVNNGTEQFTISDVGAATNYKQSVGGDYAPLKYQGTGSEMGQVWYNQGIVVVPGKNVWSLSTNWSGTVNVGQAQASASINQVVDGLRNHLESIRFHNQTNLYSTVYFCRAFNSEFNYSSNPTFVDDDKRIRVTSGSNTLQSRTYITTVGLYDANDNLLAVAKLNKPIAKTFDNENILRVRLDY